MDIETQPADSATQPEREHHYHAEATVLRGHIHLPLTQHIQPQASARLPEDGGYISQHAHDYRLEHVIAYSGAYTQVAGNQEIKHGGGYNTLATAVVEGLNILDVVTADRIVGQLSTEHPIGGGTPRISLLGTRFENLRIAGRPVEFDFGRGDIDLDLFGSRPDKHTPYAKQTDFTDKVADQHQRIREEHDKHPESIREYFAGLKKQFGRTREGFANSDAKEESVECSFINRANGSYPGHSCGHVIHIPHFGTLYLGVLHIHHTHEHPKWKTPATTVDLTMIKAKLGCAIAGSTDVASSRTNGGSKPGV